MRRAVIAGFAVVLVCACRGAPRPEDPVAARAGDEVLTVSRLASITASTAALPLRSDVMEALAMRWVEYSLLGQRAAAGDRLADRAAVLEVAWPDVRAAVSDSFRTVRLAGRIRVTPGQVDSAYAAGGVRWLRQVLKRTDPAMTRAQRDSVRAIAEGIRRRLMAGGSWEEANAQNDDPRSRAEGGDVGLVGRGQTVPPFERAAFALAPGGYSPVVETQVGFHVIYRPRLEEVREAFAAALREAFAPPLDSLYRVALLGRRHVAVVGGAAAAVRFAVAFPLASRVMADVVATYDGGRFTMSDVARYLQFLPAGFHEQVSQAPEGDLVDLVRSLVARELEWREAGQAGITVPEDRYAGIAAALAEEMRGLYAAAGLDPDALAAAASSHRGRLQAASERVDRFFEAVMRDPGGTSPLPPGVVSYLLDHGRWELSPQGLQEALLQAAMQRGERRDSVPARGAR